MLMDLIMLKFNKVYDQNSISHSFLGYALQKIKIDSKLSLAYLLLTDELNKFDFQKGDTEGFVNYALSIMG